MLGYATRSTVDDTGSLMDPTGQSWRTVVLTGSARSSRKLTTAGLAIAVAFGLGMSMAVSQPPQPRPLAANDVSILFPAPRNAKDLTSLIAMSTLNGPAGSGRVWSEADFGRYVAIAGDPKAQVANTDFPLQLPDEVKQIDAWFIAGIRIDPGAPGLSKEVIEQYGQQPQIRLIAQPVTRNSDGTIKVHDIAAHLIFSYSVLPPDPPAADSCLPRPKPDMAAFQQIVRDTVALRDQLASGTFAKAKVNTAGPLNVHPGLVGASAVPFRDALKGFLEKHLVSARLTSMAVMGLNAPEPWIFIAMQKIPIGDGKVVFVPVSGPMLDGAQVAQMLSFRGGQQVVPAPVTNNQNPITCRHAAFQKPPQPVSERKGVATAEFIDGNASATRIREIVDIIADPKKSHFFNTDCISCHTDTAQPIFRFKGKFKVDGVAEAVLPRDNWNVRNFGWFASTFRPGPPVPTATRRTATETAEVVEFINRELLGK
jgi:hypothetical protein